MKPDIKWQLLFAIAGFGLVLSLLSYQVQQRAGLCSVQVPAAGGYLEEGIVGAPQYLNPLLSPGNPVDREISSLIFDGLTGYVDGKPFPALAERWDVSEDGRIVRFYLDQDKSWHDGQSVTSEDVAFTFGLLQEENFPGNSALKRLWQTVIIRPIDDLTIEFELKEPYAGFLEATSLGILPSHLLGDETAATLPESPFNYQPIGTGPFMVEAGQDWSNSRMLTLSLAPGHWPAETLVDGIVFRFYPSEEQLLDAFEGGEIQAISSVSPSMLPRVSEMSDVRLFSNEAARYSSLLFNLGQSGSAAVRSAQVRRSLARGIDRATMIDETLNGQGVPQNGPYLSSSWAFNPAVLSPLTGNIISATVGLEEEGWILPEGETMRFKEESPLVLRFLVYDTPTNRALAQSIEKQWQELGAAPQLIYFSNWRDYRQILDSREFDVALVDITPTNDPDLYDFWSQEAIINGQNYAGWNRRRASEALEEGRKVWEVETRQPYYDTFLRYYDEDLPEFSLYRHVYTYAVDQVVEGLQIGKINHSREKYQSLPQWILLYKEVTVACPEDSEV